MLKVLSQSLGNPNAVIKELLFSAMGMAVPPKPPPAHFDRQECAGRGATLMSTLLTSLAKTSQWGETETQPARNRKEFHPHRDMSLRPPFFRFVLALMGAAMVVWGAREVALNIPGLQTINLFEISRTFTMVMIAASVAVVGMSWVPRPVFGWICWLVAVGALGWMAWDQWSTLQELGRKFEEAKAEGMPMPDLKKMLKDTQIKPGAVAVVSGLVIQFVGLCLKRKTRRAD